MNERGTRSTSEEIIEENARRATYSALSQAELSSAQVGAITGIDHSSVLQGNKRTSSQGELTLPAVKPDQMPAFAEQFLAENFPGITLEQMQGRARSNYEVVPRHALAIQLFSEGASVGEIARFLKRAHSTIFEALQRPSEKLQAQIGSQNLIAERRKLKQKVREERKLLKQRLREEREEKVRKNRQQKEKIQGLKKEKRAQDALFAETALRVVADHYGVKVDEIISRSRLKRFMQPRKTAQYIIFNETEFPLAEISGLVGRADHTTAINAIQSVERRLKIDDEFRERVEGLQEEIRRQIAPRLPTVNGNGRY